MIDPVTHMTQRKVVHLTEICQLIWPGFNTGEDIAVFVLHKQWAAPLYWIIMQEPAHVHYSQPPTRDPM